MESKPTIVAPLLLRNLLASLFIFADKSFLSLADKYKLLQTFRYLLISAFLLLLRFFPYLDASSDAYDQYQDHKAPKSNNYASSAAAGGAGDSGIGRALSQLLSIVNNIPVSSRKYEIVRSLAERLIDENLMENSESLREVNCTVLSAAFSRALGQLEAAVMDRDSGGPVGDEPSGAREPGDKVNRVLRAVWYYGDAALSRFGRGRSGHSPVGSSAEKLAAEVLWLAQKMAACGCVEEAVCKWASATHLAWLSLSAEPRLQGSLVKVSAFLFKQAKDMGLKEEEEGKKEQHRRTKMKMLLSWLPLLCRASNGTDAPVLSIGERAELERILEQTIEMLEQEEEQEKVLSLWLHHFTHCPTSDWPNLRASYTRWCTASRKTFLKS